MASSNRRGERRCNLLCDAIVLPISEVRIDHEISGLNFHVLERSLGVFRIPEEEVLQGVRKDVLPIPEVEPLARRVGDRISDLAEPLARLCRVPEISLSQHEDAYRRAE